MFYMFCFECYFHNNISQHIVCGFFRGALAVALASRGVQVTILDLKVAQGEETVRLVEEQHEKIFYKPRSPSAIFIRCNVTKSGALPYILNLVQLCFFTLFIVLSSVIESSCTPGYALHSTAGSARRCLIDQVSLMKNAKWVIVMCVPDELAAAFSRHQEMFGRLDVCINNAGIGEGKPFFNSEDWRRVIDFNLVALIDGTAKAVNLHVFPELSSLLCSHSTLPSSTSRETSSWSFLFRFKR